MSYRYSRYIGMVTREPWAITVDKLTAITELMQERASGVKLSDEMIAERVGPREDRPKVRKGAGGVAVIPVHGVIAHRANTLEASSGGTSTELVGRMLAAAVNNDEVKTVVLDLDSPGGSVSGVPELAAQISRSTTVKPIVAHVNAQASSAAFWLASQATEIVATPSGRIGSVGVFMLLVDESKRLEQEGITVNAISAGKNKLEGAPFQPLDDDTRAHLQAQVDETNREFVQSVAKGRGVTASVVNAEFGQGREFKAREALQRGMIDRIATFDETLVRLVGAKNLGPGTAAAVGERIEEVLPPLSEPLELEPAAATIVGQTDPAVEGVLGLSPEGAEAVREQIESEPDPPSDEDETDEAAILAVLLS